MRPGPYIPAAKQFIPPQISLTEARLLVDFVVESGGKWLKVEQRGKSPPNLSGCCMFRGLYEHSVDAKGRTMVPARFREVLKAQRLPQCSLVTDDSEEVLIMTTGIDACLVAYTPSAWNAFEAKLATLSQFDPAVVQLKRLYVAGASECVIDKQGRLLIPPMLREHASIDKEVVWTGMVTTIEVWAKDTWQKQMATSRQDKTAVLQALAGLGL